MKSGRVAVSDDIATVMATVEEASLCLEKTVNRWALLFYCHRAVQAFREGSSRNFRQLRDVIYAVLARPLALEQSILLQLRIIQLLSRIEEDWTVDISTQLTPLECALHLLKKMSSEFTVDANKFEEIHQKVAEAAVVSCIKNKEYNRAKRILKKYKPKDPSTLKKRILYHSIIQEKEHSNPAILRFPFEFFQQSVLVLLESYIEDSEPLLLMMAEKFSCELVEPQMNPIEADSEEMEVSEHVVEKEVEEEDVASMVTALGSPLWERSQEASVKDGLKIDIQDMPEEESERLEGGHLAGTKVSPSASEKEVTLRCLRDVCEVSLRCLGDICERRPASECGESSRNSAEPVRVSDRQAFEILSDSEDPDATFQKLDETDWTFPKVTERPASHRAKRQRVEEEETDKEEAEEEKRGPKVQSFSKAGNHPVTISSFLLGKENAISKDKTDKRMVPKQLLVTVALQAEEEPQKKPPKADSRPSPKSSKAISTTNEEEEEKEVWSDEEELFIDFGRKGRKSTSSNTSITSSKRKKWTREESQWIRAGVRKYGEGNWKAICKSYPFKDRTPVMIKDRWRTMKKLGIQ
nr:PREDICTED: telomeric repeat-binding factor 2 isoform X2 [Anolis carolinensis]|eukprot:XP_016853454.1 PREDICTED: telomeric repeat-binding factor 2 isoform X2 [Anolis carolinensis]